MRRTKNHQAPRLLEAELSLDPATSLPYRETVHKFCPL